MSDTDGSAGLVERLGARFAQPVSGPAYRRSVRGFTVSAVLFLAGYALKVLSAAQPVAAPILWLMVGAAGVVLVNAWYIVTGRTTVDAHGVRQQWMFEKSYRWSEIMRARRVRMPFSSRLALVTGRGPVRAIHGGSSELDRAFDEVTRIFSGNGSAASPSSASRESGC